MRRLFIIFLAAFHLILIPHGFSHAGISPASKIVLDNGLTVLVTEMPSSPVVSVYALVKTGSATEGEYLGTGISHFLEHMLFKGTHGRGVGEIAAKIQAVGGEINAATGKDYTIYTITVPFEQFDTALDILVDMLMHATMEPEEVERERNVIISEMKMHDDDPDSKLQEIVYKNVYLNHPYRHPIIGYETALAGLTREDLLAYYHRFYVPNNTVVSITGNIDTEEVTAKVREAFKDFKRGRSLARNLPQEPAQISRRDYEEEYPTDLARLSMSFRGISLLHPDLYALDVLAGILGQGRSSRLYLQVYKKEGLVHSIAAYNYTPVDQGLFSIDCLLEEEKIGDTVASVLAQIERIKQSGVRGEELEKIKQQVKSEHVLNHQTAAGVNFSQVIDEAYAGDPQFSQKYVDAIAQVTPEDIKRVANTYLVESALTTVALKPKREKPVAAVGEEQPHAGAIEKHVFENGLTVLVREDHAFPLISLQLSAQGGLRQETVELNGLSQMTASAWIKGTKAHTADQIAELTEGLGMDLGSFSGRNSFGLEMEFLKEQWPAALDLLKELIVHPTFPDEEIVKVKEAMKAAIRQREDSIFAFSALALKKKLFPGHPYSMEEEGTMESVEAIRREDLVTFYERFAVPDNMVLSVFGDIDAGDVLSDLKKNLGGMERRPVTLESRAAVPLDGAREQKLVMDKEQAMVLFGFHGAALGEDDTYGLEIATAILGSPFSGRMFNNIREQLGHAYTLGGNYVPGLDVGLVYFYVMTNDEEIGKVSELLKKEIGSMQTELVSEKELNDIKTYLKGAFRASQETNSALAFMAGLDELYGFGFEKYLRYDAKIDRVTREEVRDIAKRDFDLGKAAMVVTRPREKAAMVP